MTSAPDLSPGPEPTPQREEVPEESVEESHRVLTAWLSEDEGIQVLLGSRTPAPDENVETQRQVLAERRAAVAARPTYTPTDVFAETGNQAALDAIEARPQIRASFANMTWRIAMVDLASVLSVQKSIRLVGLDERVEDVLREPALLFEFCLPSQEPAVPQRIFSDLDRKGMTISSLNPNLRVAGTQPIQIQAQSAPDAPAVLMQGLVVVVHSGVSYLQVARYNGRCFLRDGYHRAAGLVRAGITTVPCVFIEAQSFEEVAPSPGLFSYEVMFGERPPRLADFWEPAVSDEVTKPAVRKVIRVRGDEFVVQV